jgi:hypothetical protein
VRLIFLLILEDVQFLEVVHEVVLALGLDVLIRELDRRHCPEKIVGRVRRLGNAPSHVIALDSFLTRLPRNVLLHRLTVRSSIPLRLTSYV